MEKPRKSMDLMHDDVTKMSDAELRVFVLALRATVRMRIVLAARREEEAARWMREAAGYRSRLAEIELARVQKTNMGVEH